MAHPLVRNTRRKMCDARDAIGVATSLLCSHCNAKNTHLCSLNRGPGLIGHNHPTKIDAVHRQTAPRTLANPANCISTALGADGPLAYVSVWAKQIRISRRI